VNDAVVELFQRRVVYPKYRHDAMGREWALHYADIYMANS